MKKRKPKNNLEDPEYIKEKIKERQDKFLNKTIKRKLKSRKELMEEKVLRRLDVNELILQGLPVTKIANIITEKWLCNEKTVRRDIEANYKQIFEKFEQEIPKIIAGHIAKYEYIYQKAVDGHDYRSALSALQSIEKLLKLHDAQPLVMYQQNNNINLENLSTDELRRLLSTEDE
jgi:hypothetical protein